MECPEEAVQEQGRNFRLLSPEELPELLDFLTGYLPESLKFHQTLLTYLEERVWEFHFYVANGWPKLSPICLHFPGMTLSPHGLPYESVGVFCPGDRLDLLELLRSEDILVDWSRPLYINFTHCDIVDELVRLYGDTGTVERVLGDIWACEEPEKTMQIEDELIEGEVDVRVQPLRAEHAEGIHELYPANDMECHEVFLRLIKTLPAAGVFAGDRLAAWMVQSYYGAMFSMQTRPEYRRKGYGTKLARYLTKAVADRGYNPFVVIRPENEASQSLYKKLGFRKLYQTVRATFTPEGWQEPELEESNEILRDNLENAVRQLKQRVIEAIQDEKDQALRCKETTVDDEEDENENENEAVSITSDLGESTTGVTIGSDPLESPGDSSRPYFQHICNSKDDVLPSSDDNRVIHEKYASEEDVDPGASDDEPKVLLNGDRRIEHEDKDSSVGVEAEVEELEVEVTEDKEIICAPSVEDSNEGDGGTESSGCRN
ncbi:helicase SWR1-like [Athalia rosae]|uniref:helicase SWR1-like n=1 Tax=Athalia rosae TaxID=37344 RepID=UPI00203469D9|nr:helicase SWR1-like [Athalia rosae]XP_020710801.2 helicase SWR1-like [Athalia rosae]XP_048512353.1 helicase SWR1-like [Athalia rosae]XP_048512355.1 helicase SWR1-like [Athalia rosae]XP_048512361.1 helicase SWR1-like [Athalia rosae]XP_048512368.1 helicase SWR1-like [Athalia rosae]XP_048512371.1 helicase SWR1-like [Athalia rosae]